MELGLLEHGRVVWAYGHMPNHATVFE